MQQAGRKNSHMMHNTKKSTNTPTPKRTSPAFQINQNGRRSAYDKLYEPVSARSSSNYQIIKVKKPSPYAKTNNFFVKGKVIRQSPNNSNMLAHKSKVEEVTSTIKKRDSLRQ